MRQDDQIGRITDLKRQISRALHGATPEPLNRLDLTVAQMRILYLLGREGEAAVGQIAERLGVAQPSATRTLDRLVRQELVERFRHPSDRRVSLHRLAPAGQGLLDHLQQGRRARLEAALRLLDPAVLDQVEESFRLLRDALDESAASMSAVAAAPHEGRERHALQSTQIDAAGAAPPLSPGLGSAGAASALATAPGASTEGQT